MAPKEVVITFVKNMFNNIFYTILSCMKRLQDEIKKFDYIYEF